MQNTPIITKFLICLIFILGVYPQNIQAETSPVSKTITGKVLCYENEISTPLPFASVQLLQKSDSSFIKGTTTNDDGVFQLSHPTENEYLILITSVGFQHSYQDVKITAKKNHYDLGQIIVSENTIVLAEASVVAQRREMVVKNDTMEYDANAFRLRENAVVEDLLKRLPGITIDEEGRIFVNGKEVKKVCNNQLLSGNHSYEWNGVNEQGKNVASGLYFIKLQTDDNSTVSKILLLK